MLYVCAFWNREKKKKNQKLYYVFHLFLLDSSLKDCKYENSFEMDAELLQQG